MSDSIEGFLADLVSRDPAARFVVGAGPSLAILRELEIAGALRSVVREYAGRRAWEARRRLSATDSPSVQSARVLQLLYCEQLSENLRETERAWGRLVTLGAAHAQDIGVSENVAIGAVLFGTERCMSILETHSFADWSGKAVRGVASGGVDSLGCVVAMIDEIIVRREIGIGSLSWHRLVRHRVAGMIGDRSG